MAGFNRENFGEKPRRGQSLQMIRLRFADNAIAITDNAPSIHLHVPSITGGARRP